MNEDWVYFQIEPSQMTFVTRIIEGYEYLGVVTALDGAAGIGFVRTVPDTAAMTRDVLRTLPIDVRIIPYDEIKSLV
jgi:hypothetical protein